MNRSRDGRKLRVVVLVDSLLNPGGGERLAIENARLIDRDRFERTLCITRFDPSHRTSEPAKSLIRGLEADGVRVLGVERSAKLALNAWVPFVRLLRREGIDVIHGHMYGSNVWAVLLGRLCRVPVVIAHEHMWSYDGGRIRAVADRRLIARGSDAFIAVSETGKKLMTSAEGLDPADIVVIPNGVAALDLPSRSAGRERFGLAPDDLVVGSVGHLREEKAFETLVEATAILRGETPNVKVIVAGEGPERERLEGAIASHGLRGSFVLAGAREDVPHFLAALDVAVCCSDFEGGPLSVMEYMRSGLPVVATRVGGLPELLGENEAGLFVPPRDPGALADALGRLLSDPMLAKRLGESGRKRQRDEHDIGLWARRVEELYAELAGSV